MNGKPPAGLYLQASGHTMLLSSIRHIAAVMFYDRA